MVEKSFMIAPNADLIESNEVTSNVYFLIEGILSKSHILSGFLMVAATFHPLAANNNAIDFPIPDDAPVMTTVFFIIEYLFIKNLKFFKP